MTRKQIDASRERRLWFTQVVMPTLTVVGAVLMVPEVRYAVSDKIRDIKEKVGTKFKK